MSRILGLMAALGFVGVIAAACANNPLSEDRDVVSRFRIYPSFANVLVGGTTKVTAIALNKHGEPTGDDVAATACDGKITITNDTTRIVYEPPERFVVTGVTAGESCINVSSGGQSATVTVNVVE
jgi:hypothetical protein